MRGLVLSSATRLTPQTCPDPGGRITKVKLTSCIFLNKAHPSSGPPLHWLGPRPKVCLWTGCWGSLGMDGSFSPVTALCYSGKCMCAADPHPNSRHVECCIAPTLESQRPAHSPDRRFPLPEAVSLLLTVTVAPFPGTLTRRSELQLNAAFSNTCSVP